MTVLLILQVYNYVSKNIAAVFTGAKLSTFQTICHTLALTTRIATLVSAIEVNKFPHLLGAAGSVVIIICRQLSSSSNHPLPTGLHKTG